MPDKTRIPELLEQPVARAAREVALRLLDKAEKERHRLHDAGDPEALHDFRVAVRRLRSWLRAFKQPLRGSVSGRHRDSLRAVAHATNEGRDAEVHVEWLRAHPEFFWRRRRPGTEWLIERLSSKGRVAAGALHREVKREFVPVRRELSERLEAYSWRERFAAPDATFAEATALRGREYGDELRNKIAEVRGPGDKEAAHAARIAAKHLRYLLEPVASAIPAGEATIARLKALQEVLGALHDAHVFGAEVSEAMVAAAAEPTANLSRAGLLAIARRLRAGVKDSFASFAKSWSGKASDEFWADLEGALDWLRTRGGWKNEIERKYLLSALPDDVRGVRPLDIEQGYLPGKQLVERLRRVKEGRATRFYRTVKLGKGLARAELEEQTTRAVFDRMWPLTKGRRLKKRRRRVPDGALTWEIDDFADRKLVLAEVELPVEDTAVEIPKWLRPLLVREVTDEEEFQNARLAR